MNIFWPRDMDCKRAWMKHPLLQFHVFIKFMYTMVSTVPPKSTSN